MDGHLKDQGQNMLKTNLTKEQFITQIKAAVQGTSAHLSEEDYRLTAARHAADVARETWDNDAYVNIFMGGEFWKVDTMQAADAYFEDQYDQVIQFMEDCQDYAEDEYREDTVYTPEQFIEKLDQFIG